MLYRLVSLLCFLLFTQSVHAGPWLREKGHGFTAVSVAGTYYLDTATQTYLEYGLNENTTLIADIGIFRPRSSVPGGYTTLSFRRALTQPDATSKWAYELGLGAGWTGEFILPHLRTGLTWGRGMNWGDKSGWATMDAVVIWDLAEAVHIAKIDTTVGMNFTDVTAGMLQVYTAYVGDKFIATVAPSLIVKPKKAQFRIQIGAESQVGNFGNSALKIGLWREF